MKSTLKSALLVVLIVFSFWSKSEAQITSSGKTFYMSFMEMETRSGGLPDTLLLFVTSEVNTTLVLDNPRVSGSNQSVSITAGKVNRIEVDRTYYYPVGSEFPATDVNSKKGLRIVAKDPVNVYCLNLELNRSDATFILPYESMPAAPEFYIPSFAPNAITSGSNYAESEFVVIGMDNGVKVEITPTANTKGGKTAGTPFTVTLSKGQVYEVQSVTKDGTNNTDPAATSWATTGAIKGDLTGTRIRVVEGCGKVNVFSGARSSYIPKGNCSGASGRDHLYTQVIPTLALGKEYVLMPFSGQTKGYVYKVIAAYDTTKVYINGTLANTILKRGQWIYQDVTSGTAECVRTDKPAYVAQYMKNGACSGLGGSAGDAALFLSPDVNQRLIRTLVGTATTSNMNQHWVNILVAQNSTKSVKVNGVALASTAFTTVSCGKFAYAQVKVNNPSSNTVTSDSGFICVAYGVGPYESYAYSAGAVFENLNFDISVTRKTMCPGEDVKIGAIVVGNPKIRGYRWNFGDGTSDTGKNVVHKFKKLGSFFVVLKIPVTLDCGLVDTITRSKIVTIKQGPILDLSDTTTQCASTLNLKLQAPNYSSKFIYRWQDSTKLSTYVVTKPMKVWLKVTDTSTNCTSVDSTWVRRADAITAAIKYDSLDQCYKTDVFAMRDGTKYNNDGWKWSNFRIYDSYKGYYYSKDSIAYKYKFDTISVNKLRYIVQSKKGCRDTLDTLLVVYPYPVAKMTSSWSYFCQNQQITLADSSVSKEGVGKSYWNFGNGDKDTVPPSTVKYTFKTSGSFKVQLITETPFGCRDTIDSTFVVQPSPINVIDVKTYSACLKTNLFDFTDKSSISSGTYTTGWTYGKTPSTSTNSAIKGVKFTDTGLQMVILKNTSSFGCSDIDTVKVRINPEPTANFVVTDSSTCFAGNFFNLDDASTVPKNATLTTKAAWKYQDGTMNLAKTVLNKKFSSPGKYWIRIISSTTDGCLDSFQREVQVYPMPQADITINGKTQCLTGNKYIFKQKYPFAGTAGVHVWKTSDGASGAGDSFVHSFTSIGAFRIFHSIQSNEGCFDSTSEVVNVVASPVTSFTTSKDTACLGGHLFAFTDNTVFGSTYTSKWTLGDGTTGTAKNITGKGYLSAGKFDIKLVITTSAGCSDSLTKTVNVWPVPVANFAMNNAEQCLVGNSFVASNITQENSATGVAYTWYVKGIAMANTKTVSAQTMPDTGDYPVKLKVISDKGCATEKTLVLRVNEHPSVIVSGANACALAPIQFNAAAKVNRGSIASYSWNFADGGTANISNPKHIYATDGSYGVTVTVTSDKGCVTTTAAYPITVLPKPVANFDAEYLLSRGLETDWKFTFTGKNTDTYNWLFQDGQASTSSNPFFMTFSGTGDFNVTLIASNSSGCADTASKKIFLKPELLFYLPTAFSPNIDGLNEEFKPYQAFGLSKYRMTIMNRWGEILFYSEDPAIGWKGLDSKGEPVMEGVYAFAVTFRYIDGAMHAYKGTVMIIK